MPRAVAPLFVAALLILVVAGVIAGVRGVGDDAVNAIGPGETPTATERATSPGATEPDAGEAGAVVPSPTASPSPTLATPSPTPTGTVTAPDDRAEGQQAQPGATETPTVTASPTVAPTTPTASPTDERTPLALDDMPETGGGAATVLAGFIVLTGAAGLVTRRR